jgi:hypothetical protein
MELSVKNLQDSGSFTGAPVEKEIKWNQDGKEMVATAFVRKLSYRSAVSDAKQHYGRGDIVAGRISSCICDKDGKPVFSVEDITGCPIEDKSDSHEEKERKKSITDRGPLDHNLTIALLDAISEVNYPIKKKN